ncbi:hypothetical protein CYMTET_19617 [Cymbomonas tetramitiformis]|uniref:Uncharacterized protein n=1 Tax=Cymbomonas tetramitiformis TaxID=36881 RepID=A0AAE0G5P5_9CHLO|nr:hypothetical protein CYMTET_19617 [Cymbomonas tetramitiformis]
MICYSLCERSEHLSRSKPWSFALPKKAWSGSCESLRAPLYRAIRPKHGRTAVEVPNAQAKSLGAKGYLVTAVEKTGFSFRRKEQAITFLSQQVNNMSSKLLDSVNGQEASTSADDVVLSFRIPSNVLDTRLPDALATSRPETFPTLSSARKSIRKKRIRVNGELARCDRYAARS